MDRIVTSYEPSKISAQARRSLLACGLWLRAAFAGASATAIGVVQLFEGEWSALAASSTAVAGAALAVLSYRRAQAALNNMAKPATLRGATPAAAHR
jgi:hypothetical protein